MRLVSARVMPEYARESPRRCSSTSWIATGTGRAYCRPFTPQSELCAPATHATIGTSSS
ncbi:hypothetical protein DPMN_052937 [Dreissena polymorpha]|uniref:Uncharacterized protein n=1 Tax=Dreissena polymorpha TaxID=45954 RepID=A0A9D4CMB9_DREPO|nr:hypothetical protein DPMN_052937 [Dreissena polymorpha]